MIFFMNEHIENCVKDLDKNYRPDMCTYNIHRDENSKHSKKRKICKGLKKYLKHENKNKTQAMYIYFYILIF